MPSGNRKRRQPPAIDALMAGPAFAGADDLINNSVFGDATASGPTAPSAPDVAPEAEPQVAEPSTQSGSPAPEKTESAAPAGKPTVPEQAAPSAPQPPAAPPATQPDAPQAPQDAAEPALAPADAEPPALPEPLSRIPEGDASSAAPALADVSADSSAEAPEPAAPRPKESGRRRRGRPESTEAHKAVAQSWKGSTLDLQLGKKDWQAVPVRLAEGLADELTRRAVDDTDATGKRMTQAHYVDAAFRRHLPATLEDQVALAEKYLTEGNVGAKGKQSTYRLGPDVAPQVRSLPHEMKRVGRPRTAVHVCSAVVKALLDELDTDGPLVFPAD